MHKPLITIVSPVYQAEKILPELVKQIHQSVSLITKDYEIVLVEDSGPDDSWKVIEKLAKDDDKIRGFRLSRNFGQHHAITCGLDQARGEWVIVMDCDLQDQPKEIIKLFEKSQEGFDVVLARREMRQDTLLKRTFSKYFLLILE